MPGFGYKRTENEDDDQRPLPVLVSENGDIEMNDMGTEETPDNVESEEVYPVRNVQKTRRLELFYLGWAITVSFALIVVLIVAIIFHQPDRHVKWCCINNAEVEKCQNMSLAFASKTFYPKFDCILSSSIDECVSKINTDHADVITIPNSYLYKYREQLFPIMAEDFPNTSFGSYLLAVVHKSDNKANLTNAGLSGRIACVEDMELTTGYLHNKSILQVSPCQNPHALVHLFSNNLCVPHSQTLDGGCRGKSLEKCIFQSDPTKPVVSFVDSNTLENYFASNSSYTRSDYRLLCPDGKKAQLQEFKTCHLLWQPTRAVVISSKERGGNAVEIPMDIVEVLHVAQLYFGSHSTSAFNMFKSKPPGNLLFQDKAEKLVPLLHNCSAQSYLGQEYMKYRLSYDCLSLSNEYQSCLLSQYT